MHPLWPRRLLLAGLLSGRFFTASAAFSQSEEGAYLGASAVEAPSAKSLSAVDVTLTTVSSTVDAPSATASSAVDAPSVTASSALDVTCHDFTNSQ